MKANDVKLRRLLACPFCGSLPKIEKLAGFDCVRHINSECPISPVIGWSLCVWQERKTNGNINWNPKIKRRTTDETTKIVHA